MKTHLVVGVVVSFFGLGAAGLAQSEKAQITIGGRPVTAAIDDQTVRLRYEEAKTLARGGDHAGALSEFLWLYDIGMAAVPSYRGVRTSFLLGEIGRMMSAYPPAREALAQRCDEAELRFFANKEDRQAGVEFAALAATLKEDERLLKAFDSLASDDPRRRALGLRAYRLLVPKRRYADALSALPYEGMQRLVEARARRPVMPSRNPRAAEITRRNDVKTMVEYVEVLAGAGELGPAKEMMAKLLEFDASAETRRSLEAALKRAGRAELL